MKIKVRDSRVLAQCLGMSAGPMSAARIPDDLEALMERADGMRKQVSGNDFRVNELVLIALFRQEIDRLRKELQEPLADESGLDQPVKRRPGRPRKVPAVA